MIRFLPERPEKIFDHLSSKCYWIEGFDKEGVYCRSALEIANEGAAIHLSVQFWSHNILKSMKEDFKLIRLFCKEAGCKYMVASFTDVQDMVWPKFIRQFGFPKPTLIYLSKMEI